MKFAVPFSLVLLATFVPINSLEICTDYLMLIEKNFNIPNTEIIADNFDNFTIVKYICNSNTSNTIFLFTDDNVVSINDDYKNKIYHIEEDFQVYTQGFEVEATLDNTQWGLDEIDGTFNSKYEYTLTGKGVNVYVIDSGIFPNEDIASKIDASRGIDLTGLESPTSDCLGHGTHVASTVGGTKYGVAKDVTLIPIRVFACSITTSTSLIIAALNYIKKQLKNNEKSVINMSLSGSNSDILVQVIKDISSKAIVVAAAGNYNINAIVSSPANAPEAIAVGALDRTVANKLFKASFSNYGKVVGIYAPGVTIKGALNKPTGFAYYSGTSMATPGVAGVVALIYEEHSPDFIDKVKNEVYKIATKGIIGGQNPGDNNVNAKTPQKGNKIPTEVPTKMPTESPIRIPTMSPTMMPTERPTMMPTERPTDDSTLVPTLNPFTKAPSLCRGLRRGRCRINKDKCVWTGVYGCFRINYCKRVKFMSNCEKRQVCKWKNYECVFQ
jgi:ribosomal protein L18